MGNLFNTGGNQYDDEGNLMVNHVTAIESGELTLSVGGTASGALTSMYDNDITTHYALSSAADESSFTWDFKKKYKWKNIYAVLTCYITGGTAYYYLEGSNDADTWTALASGSTGSGDDDPRNLLASNAVYRYIRVRFGKSAGTLYIGIKEIKGVL